VRSPGWRAEIWRYRHYYPPSFAGPHMAGPRKAGVCCEPAADALPTSGSVSTSGLVSPARAETTRALIAAL